MKSDFKTWILVLIFGLPVFLLGFIVVLYVGNCGFSTDCSKVGLPEVIHTPIPTLLPATLPAPEMVSSANIGSKCTVTARNLLSAWITAGYSETQKFEFTDVNGATCEATYGDVKPLFIESNLWYSGTLACASCHNSDLAFASVRMDLSNYAGVVAGSRRTSSDAQGNDILGGGDWESSLLNKILFVDKTMPLGHPADAYPEEGPTIRAGEQKPIQ
jgi:hypothetical protein